MWLVLRRWLIALVFAALALQGAQAAERPSSLQPALKAPTATRAALLGVAEAGDRLVAVGAHGLVLLSDDFGVSWRQAKSVPTQALLTAVFFLTPREGWAVGHDAVILHTLDAGETWALKYVNAERGVPLFTVLFLDEEHGFAMGALGLVLETDNGGTSWTERLIRRGDVGDYNLNRLLRSGDQLYVASEFGLVYRSTNRGKTFQAVQSPSEADLWNALALADGTLIFCSANGEVWRTRRDLTSWSELKSPTSAGLVAVATTLDGRLAVAGLNGVIATADRELRALTPVLRTRGPDFTALAPGPRGRLVALSNRGVSLVPDRPGALP